MPISSRTIATRRAALSNRPSTYPAVRPGMLPNVGGSRAPSGTAARVEQLVQPEVWTMFDTLILSAAAVLPAAAAFNYANYTTPQTFFNGRTLVNAGAAITSMTTISGYVDFPYKAYGIGIEVFSDVDQDNAGQVANAAAFIETIINYSSVILSFSSDPKLIIPVADCPAGGGVHYGFRTDDRPPGGGQLAAGVTNGQPTLQSRNTWGDYILFRGDTTPFSVQLVTTAGGVARINALQPLVAPFQAGIRIKFWGYRGKALVLGAPFRG